MNCGFFSGGRVAYETALVAGVRARVEERYCGALTRARMVGGLLELRLQIEIEVKAEVRRLTPSKHALFIS